MDHRFVRVNEEQFSQIECCELFACDSAHLDIGVDESKLCVTHNNETFAIKQDFRARTFYITSNLVNFLEQ